MCEENTCHACEDTCHERRGHLACMRIPGIVRKTPAMREDTWHCEEDTCHACEGHLALYGHLPCMRKSASKPKDPEKEKRPVGHLTNWFGS